MWPCYRGSGPPSTSCIGHSAPALCPAAGPERKPTSPGLHGAHIKLLQGPVARDVGAQESGNAGLQWWGRLLPVGKAWEAPPAARQRPQARALWCGVPADAGPGCQGLACVGT